MSAPSAPHAVLRQTLSRDLDLALLAPAPRILPLVVSGNEKHDAIRLFMAEDPQNTGVSV